MLGHTGLADIDAKLEKLTMEALPTTGWRGSSHGSAGEFPTTPLVGRSGVAISCSNTIGSPRGTIDSLIITMCEAWHRTQYDIL